MRQDVALTSFAAGELSPRLKGRIDLAKYYEGAATLKNMVTLPQGGVTKRPGTLFVATAKDQNAAFFRVRVIPFIFSTVQAYALECSAGNVRVYANDGVVLNGGNPVDISVPYGAADWPLVWYTQSADTLFLFHPNFPPATLTRSSNTSWAYSVIAFRDGPYLTLNATATTLTPSATSGSITITASATTGINNGQGFLNSDVGRLIRIFQTHWAWVFITAVNSTTQVTATVQAAVTGGATGAQGTLDNTNATSTWMLGKWSGTTGYPFVATFWQQRLLMLGTNNQPNAVEGSVTADFTNMAPSDAAGVVAAAHALDWIIADEQVNAARWASVAGSAQAAQLGIGTSGAEHIFQAANLTAAISPTNVQTFRETTYGSPAGPRPLRIGKALLFTDASGRKLREWVFQWQVNGYIGPDILEFSEHMTRGPVGSNPATWGIREMVYQKAPHSVIWAVRNDGGLIAFTYDRDQQLFAPHQHQLGGEWYGGPPIVESVATIPSPDSTYDEIWLSVLRTINGVPTRFIEVMTRYFDAQPIDQAFFVDCGLQSALTFPNATVTPSGFALETDGTPEDEPPAFTGTGTLTASAGVFSAGNVNAVVRLNNGLLTITSFTDSQHVTAQVLQNMASLAPAAANAWSMTALFTTFGGVSYLNGETAAVLGDGAVFGTQVVSGGAVTIASPGASRATVGLPYSPAIVGMPFEPQRAAAAASQGKLKAMKSLWLRLHETLGCNFGMRVTDDFTKEQVGDTEPLQSRSASDAMGQPPALFSGIIEVRPQGSYDREGQFLVTQDDPLPLTVLAILAKGEVGEMPIGTA